MGRGIDHFFDVGAKIENAAWGGNDPYEKGAWEISAGVGADGLRRVALQKCGLAR